MPWIEVPELQPRRTARARANADRWYTIKNAASADEAELLLYDEIGGWWGSTADEFVADLRQVTAPNLRVRVNSPGGSVTDGLAIANALRSHPANVTVQVDGLAASIASVIAIAGDRLVMMPQSMMMVHDASGLCVGDAAEMQKTADVLNLISNNIASAYAAKAGGTAADWRAVMLQETWYVAADAVAAGLADEVVATPGTGEDAPEMHARFDLAAYGYNGPPQAERPKPAPPAAKPAQEPEPKAQQQPTLVISIADVLDDDTIARLRAAVTQTASTQPVGTGHTEAEAAGPDAHPPEASEPAAAHDDIPDQWAAQTAHLTAPDDWTALTSHLTESSATGA